MDQEKESDVIPTEKKVLLECEEKINTQKEEVCKIPEIRPKVQPWHKDPKALPPSTLSYTYAGYQVCNDKIYEYATYYLRGNPDDYIDKKNEDTLQDYEKFIDVTKYENETINTGRIFKKIGFFEKYKKFLEPPSHIIDNIYIGSAFNAAHYATLKELNIKVIINVSYELSKYHQKYKPTDFIYHQYTIHDDNKYSISKKKFDEIYKTITKYDKNVNILLHCYMGASRSVIAVAYYLAEHEGYSADKAIDFIKEKRSIANPTHRLFKDLIISQI